ncbi:MAG: GxxExxY protein [Ignavibacteriales bacterium]|nr:GxxExxY protein [Ignavibacteriales bacterium]
MKREFPDTEYPLKELTERIIAAAYKVHNTFGSGFVEKVYENALVEELQQQGHKIEQQKKVSVEYNRKSVGDFVADPVVDGSVLLELKAVKNFEKSFDDKLLHYLKATSLQVGLLINFGKSVEIRRKVNTESATKSEKSA